MSVGVYYSTISGVGGRRKPKSYKTTVPKEVVKALALEAHDRLEWDVRLEGVRKFVVVAKAEK